MSLDKNKIDKELGYRVSDYLKSKCVETPFKENNLTDNEKKTENKKEFYRNNGNIRT